MKKLIVLVVLFLAAHGSSFAQSAFPELDKIKQIKLLESTAEDVKRIFAGYPFVQPRFIPGDKASVSIDYSNGRCSPSEIWNIPAGKVTEIIVRFRVPVYPPNMGIDLSKLTKEKIYVNRSREFVYHDKSAGIGYEVDNGDIREIVFRPSKENYSRLCDDKKVREDFSSASWFSEKLAERRYIKGDIRAFAWIEDLILNATEVMASCPDAAAQPTEPCSEKSLISVETIAKSTDPTDVLTYAYEVSGGRIVGNGKRVLWDLSGAKAGIYTISAGVDNGCGICYPPITKIVVVKKCPDCK